MPYEPPSLSTTLLRGLRRRCPRCGEGALFEGWFRQAKECSRCHLRFEQNPGDTWALWLIGDRLFVGLTIILVFIVFRSASWSIGLGVLAIAAVPLVITMPQRMGVCLGFDYFVRAHWGDLANESRESSPLADP